MCDRFSDYFSLQKISRVKAVLLREQGSLYSHKRKREGQMFTIRDTESKSFLKKA